MPSQSPGNVSSGFSDEVSFFRDTLREKRGLFVPVIGSGLSQGLLSWEALLRKLSDALPQDERQEISDWLDRKQFLQAAAHLENSQCVGRARVIDAIRANYGRPKVPRPSVYDLVAALPVDHFLTTNYDPWLKDAVAAHLRISPRVYTPLDPGAFASLEIGSAPLVMMLHGDADRPETCVLSERGYAALLHTNAPYRHGMRGVLTQRRLVFIGHSVSDLDLLELMAEWQQIFAPNGGAPRHVFLGADIGPATASLLRSRGIEPIDCGNFSQLPAMLAFLAEPPTTNKRGDVRRAVPGERSLLCDLLLDPNSGGVLPKRVLVVEDDETMAKAIARLLSRHGIQVVVTYNGSAALKLVTTSTFDVILSDVKMPGMDGILLARSVAEISEVPVIMLTGEPSISTARDALDAGCFHYLTKPASSEEIMLAVSTATQANGLRALARRSWTDGDSAYGHLMACRREILSVMTEYSSDDLFESALRHKLRDCVFEFEQAASTAPHARDHVQRLTSAIRKVRTSLDRVRFNGKFGVLGYLNLVREDVEAESREIKFEIDVADGVESCLPSLNAALLLFCTMELIDNAKDAVGNKGTIRVQVRRQATFPNLAIRVWNSGTPIPEERLARVFNEGESTKGIGRGLGLALVKRMAARLSGDVRVTQDPGTTFELLVPLQPA